MSEFKKIGVWQTAFLGDAVLTLPLITALKERYPEAEIHFFVRKGFGELFSAQPEIAEVHEFDKRGEQKTLGDARRYGKQIRKMGLDLWISTHASFRSAAVARATGIKKRIGYKSPWYNRLAYHKVVDRRFDELEEIERLHQLLLPLGIEPPAPEPKVVLPELAKGVAEAVLAMQPKDVPIVGLHPGSTWPTKCWPIEYYAVIARAAASAGCGVMIFAGPGEEEASAKVRQLAGRGVHSLRITDMGGKLKLPELAAVIGRLDAYVTNDSGPMHLAWMQKTPTLAMFGPTVRKLGFFPRGDHSVVLESELECRPCGLHGHETCPEKHHKCMTEITPQMAWDALIAMLGLDRREQGADS
ncbi:glycosyltransferase family 9 protein [Salidesulfovibrio brasiliensis]|uniref:glycosyltransferase family 9 protein n=1 Tax=Salidesulfovibrio brasiliensis TaxID=221711 RepID=UPI0006D2A838|nr:glycosyltransferase family 9 protein [Salidesulfovibrio brasiliensis]